MRVLFTNDPPVIRYGIARGMARIGCEVQVFTQRLTRYDDQANSLGAVIDSFRPDVLFTEGDPPNYNKPATYELCRRRGLPHVYWAIQDPLWHRQVSRYSASHSDLVFTTAAELVPVYRGMGKPAELLLFACNPEVHHRTLPNEAYRHQVIFVGCNYAERTSAALRMIAPAVEGGYDFQAWGLWWDDETKPYYLPSRYAGGYLGHLDLAAACSSADVVLGLHLDASSPTQTSVRTFEVLGCGAFYLTQYTPAHERLFVNGQHLVWSKSATETAELLAFYLPRPELRERIATAGMAEAHAKHTVTHRALEVREAIHRHLGIA